MGVDVQIMGRGDGKNRGGLIDESGNRIGVGRDKIDFLVRHVDFGIGGARDVFPPSLGGFGVIVPGAG